MLVEPFKARPLSNWNYYLMDSTTAKGPVISKVREWLINEAGVFAAEFTRDTGVASSAAPD